MGGLALLWGHEGFWKPASFGDSGAAPNSFAHNSPNNPGLRTRAARRSPLWYHRTCLSQPEASSVHGGFPGSVLRPPVLVLGSSLPSC